MNNFKKFPDGKENFPEASEKFTKVWGFNPTELDTKDEYARGFSQIPNVIFRYLPRLGLVNQAGLAILLIYLLSRDFNGKGNCFPGLRTIAMEIDSSPGTVGRHLKKLQLLGLIEIKERRTKKGQITNHYTWEGLKKKLIGFLIDDKLMIEKTGK